MKFFRRAEGTPQRLGIFPGAFNPPTIAHLGIARAALGKVDEVVLVLPRVFPHKHYAGASFEDRIGLLVALAEEHPAFSVAAADRGLFLEIASECREAYGSRTRLSFLCGRDAAERIAGWDYGDAGEFSEMLRAFDLLVAARAGEYQAPKEFAAEIQQLVIPCDLDAVSASDVRTRITSHEPWEHLVPEALHQRVRAIYR